MKTPQFIQLHFDNQVHIRSELFAGLQAASAYTSPKYLYDALGSKLFEAITEVPEYYPTRVEAGIFDDYGAAMAGVIPQGAQLIDLGAGNCKKAARLFDRLQPSAYVAIDISVDFLQDSLAGLQRHYPNLTMLGVGMDFSESLALPSGIDNANQSKPRVFFYPGSSIGNFTPDAALQFLKQVHSACAQPALAAQSGAIFGGILIGVDLIKAKSTLEAAYDDALGVTAAFNRNLLLHINRMTGTDFNVADWAHVALYNETRSRIEMHLEAKRDVTVRWEDGERQFVSGERIHTENSYKWTVAGFGALLAQAGFQCPTVWTDDAKQFAVLWAPA
jgi:L-histidine Nalpha-methyltransferase